MRKATYAEGAEWDVSLADAVVAGKVLTAGVFGQQIERAAAAAERQAAHCRHDRDAGELDE